MERWRGVLVASVVGTAFAFGLWLGSQARRAAVPGVPASEHASGADAQGTLRSADAPEPVPERILAAPEAQTAPRPEPRTAPEPPWRVRVTARVVDPVERPVEGAALLTLAGRVLGRSDAEGRLALDADFERQGSEVRAYDRRTPTTELLIQAPGFRCSRDSVVLAAGGAVHLGTIRLEPGTSVAGLARDENGAPLAGAVVGWLPVGRTLEEGWGRTELFASGVSLADLAARSEGGAAVSASDGRFELQGVPLEDGCLFGAASGRGIVQGEAFRPVPGDGRVQVLDFGARFGTPRRIEGYVRAADGTGISGCRVEIRIQESGGGARSQVLEALGYVGGGGPELRPAGWAFTDASGAFATTLELRSSGTELLWLEAFDPGRRGYPAAREGVPVDAGPFELVLGAPRWLRVRVLDAEGQPAAWSHVAFLDAPGDTSLVRTLQPLGEEGTDVFLLPREPFRVRAMGPGFRPAVFGPFVPEALGDALPLVLERGQAVRGRVTVRGQPLPGAHLSIQNVPGGAFCGLSMMLAPLDRPFQARGALDPAQQDATTDAEGAFVLSLFNSGSYVVTVDAEGFGWSVFGPFDLDRDAGAEGLELALEPSGALEGQVLVPPGSALEGRIVGATSGWGVAFTASTDARGRFRIDGLAPGGYQLRPCLPPAASRQTFFSSVGADTPIEFDTTVRSGAVTHVDLDLRDEEDFVLRGTFRFAELEPWTVSLRAQEDPRSQPIARATTDSAGGFEFHLRRGGALTLVLDHRGGPGFQAPLTLVPGENTWNAAPASASLTLPDLDSALGPNRPIRCRLRGVGPEGLEFLWERRFFNADIGVVPPWVVPAGRVEVLRVGYGDDAEAEPTRLGEVEMRAGEERIVSLGATR